MTSVEELLVNTLQELVTADLRRFQWYLKNDGAVPASVMENADILKTVDTMVERFGPKEALKLALTILRKMNQNYLAEQLENKNLSAKNLKDELNLANPKRDEVCLKAVADKAQFFDNHWPDLIQRVKNVKPIADRLLQQKIITEEQYSQITHGNLTPADSMRKICDIMRSRGDNVKAKFISVLEKEERYLLQDLSESTP